MKSRSEGLVWVKDGDLTGYFRRRHPHVRHVRHTGRQRTDALVRGREAGRSIEEIERPTSAAVARLGWKKILAREIVSPADLDANYIRRTDAEIFHQNS